MKTIRGMLKRLRKGLSQIPADSTIAFVGVLLIGVGVGMMSLAWSLIVIGALFYGDCLLGRRK